MKLAPPVAKPLPTPKGKPLRRAPAPVRARVPDEPSESDVDSSELDSNAHESLARSHNPSLGASSPPSKPTHIASRIVVGAAHDPLEHEADAIADRVMRMSAPHDAASPRTHPAETPWANTLRRACKACCDACEDDDEPLRREPAAGQRGGIASDAFAARLDARTRLGGSPLTPDARAFLEPRLRVGLDHVRTHTDASADSLARNVGARAFTVGQHIFFAAGELSSQSSSGMRLLAHEVAHTLQNAGSTKLHRTPEATVRRTPEGESETTEALESIDYGEDLSTQSKQLRTLVALLRDNLLDLIGDLMRPTRVYDDENGMETFPSELAQFRVPAQMREDAEAASRRFIKITEYLDGQSDRSAVLMSQWLDAAAELIAALQTCVRWIRENGGEIGKLIGATHHRRLAVLEARTHKLMATAFFSKGADLEIVAREAEEAAYLSTAKQTLEAQLEQQLGYLRQETEADWRAASESQLHAELEQLRAELETKRVKVFLGDAEARAIAQWDVRVLETKIEVIGRLADELDFEPGPESPSVIVGRWWKMTRGGQNTERLAQLAIPYARRGTNHDLWVVETVLEWLWRSQDDAAEFARYFVKGLGDERRDIFAKMAQNDHGVSVLMSLRMKVDKDLVVGDGLAKLWSDEPTTGDENAWVAGEIGQALDDELSQDQLRARIEAGEQPALELTLGAGATNIRADVVGSSVKIWTNSHDFAKKSGVRNLYTGIYVDYQAIIKIFNRDEHEVRYCHAAHLGDVIRGELDKSLPWNVSTAAMAEAALDFLAEEAREFEDWVIPAIDYFVDEFVPADYRHLARPVGAAAKKVVKGLTMVVVGIAGVGVGLASGAIEMVQGIFKLGGVVLDVVNALMDVDDPANLWPLVMKGLEAIPGKVAEAFEKWKAEFIAADKYKASGMVGVLVGKIILAIIDGVEVVHFIREGAKLIFKGFRRNAGDIAKVLPDGGGAGRKTDSNVGGHREPDGHRERHLVSPEAHPPDSARMGNDQVTPAQKQGEIDYIDDNVGPVDGTNVVKVDFGEGRAKWDIEGAVACRINSPKDCVEVDESGRITESGSRDSVDGGPDMVVDQAPSTATGSDVELEAQRAKLEPEIEEARDKVAEAKKALAKAESNDRIPADKKELVVKSARSKVETAQWKLDQVESQHQRLIDVDQGKHPYKRVSDAELDALDERIQDKIQEKLKFIDEFGAGKDLDEVYANGSPAKKRIIEAKRGTDADRLEYAREHAMRRQAAEEGDVVAQRRLNEISELKALRKGDFGSARGYAGENQLLDELEASGNPVLKAGHKPTGLEKTTLDDKGKVRQVADMDAETATEVIQLKTGGPDDISSVEQIANTIEYALKVGKTPRFIMDAKGDNKQAAFQKELEGALARWPESERDTIRKLVQAEYRDFPNLYG